jgi:hypothetical protein
MNHNIPSLQVNVCEVDGTTTTFLQNAATEASSLLDGFHPAEIFYQATLTITDKDSITSFPVSKITRIELVCEELPHLVFPVGIVDAVELTAKKFQSLIRNPVMRQQWGQLATKDDFLITFMEIQMTDGSCFFLTMEIPAGDPAQTWKLKGVPWNGSGLCFRMRSGGVAVLNLAHLTRLTFFPRPPEAPADAWHARQIHSAHPAMANPPPAPVPFYHQTTKGMSKHTTG